MIETLSVRTNTRTELLDLTSQVQEVVSQNGVSEGLCHIFDNKQAVFFGYFYYLIHIAGLAI